MAARKSRQATRGNQRKPLPVWVWMAVGMVMGVVLMLGVLGKDWAPMFSKKTLPQPNPQAVAPVASEPLVSAAASAEAAKAKKPTYEFYQVLPEKEVLIPDAEISARVRAEQVAKAAQAQKPATTTPVPGSAPATTAAAVPAARFLLQAGSFPDIKAADEVKAKLALLGFSAQVQPVTVDGKTWNRVRLGPYPSASDLEVAKRTLAENGVSAIAMKETASR